MGVLVRLPAGGAEKVLIVVASGPSAEPTGDPTGTTLNSTVAGPTGRRTKISAMIYVEDVDVFDVYMYIRVTRKVMIGSTK